MVSKPLWLRKYYHGRVYSFLAQTIFQKIQLQFFEILILLCFVIGISMLIFSIFGILEGLTKLTLMKVSGMIEKEAYI